MYYPKSHPEIDIINLMMGAKRKKGMKYQAKVGLPSILHCMRIREKANSGVFSKGYFS